MIVTWECSRHYGVTIFTYTGKVLEDRGDLLIVALTLYTVNGREYSTDGIMTVHRSQVKVLEAQEAQ